MLDEHVDLLPRAHNQSLELTLQGSCMKAAGQDGCALLPPGGAAIRDEELWLERELRLPLLLVDLCWCSWWEAGGWIRPSRASAVLLGPVVLG